MGKMRRRILWGVFLTAVIVGSIYFGLRAVAALEQGYSWDEMDWDSDGTTTISEFFASSDIGKRQEVENGRGCVEYFAYKDGLAVKKLCDQSISQ